ncbi:ABC transporter permease [Clostridium botulinum]|uniref:ABC transporter permease n=1 Tax=Clostridium botulinum C/D str. DC5 TaxID=1443128 RepID=A0A0A0IH44_CLOBO|nr:ABC transporter permease [Clostridium botulinum]KEI01720.1 ABC transporter permease [Clostridium botulinum C/D str. BKT75002]KEI07464.1 ABC transporter permease [Clostridium botulinum C/D str. BKT2873]KGM93245.1 ABC transporter permease [Clostridium botulinum D str. CCUG 7971]KGM99913.1 ABC transporter permease [Clostridium botulinum C/D str. DC5]KOC49382.1 ABC transporter permease [Clostridium botulinum]
MELIISFLSAAVVAGTPLLLATLGEILTEKVGNLNLGVEGMMLMGAVMGFAVSMKTENPILSILAGAIAGTIGALIYAFLTVGLKANQVVSGLTLSIFGTGFSSMIGKGLNLIGQRTPETVKSFFEVTPIPILNKIPIVGPIFFNQDKFIYISYILVIVLGVYVYNTRLGLNLRAVGENPACADASSINVNLYKYINILIGGALCGLGGAYLSLVYIPSWQENVTAGRGWIAVALVIFAAWNPYKAILGSYLFGGLGIVAFRFEILTMHISQYLIDMLPYIVTVVILITLSIKKNNKNAPPNWLGNSYFREER